MENIVQHKALGKILLGIIFFLLPMGTNVLAQRVTYPNAINSFTGGNTYCQGDASGNLSVSFSICELGSGQKQDAAITVTWYSNSTNSTSGGTSVSSLASDAATTTYTYAPSTAVAGTLYYYAEISWTNSGGACGNNSPLSTGSFVTQTQTVTVYASVPAQPGTISGASSVNPSTGGLIYSISAVPNTIDYTWTVPTGWTINSGQNTESITVTSGAAGQDGDITVTANNVCGSSVAQTLAVTVQSFPTITLDAANVTVCQGIISGDLSYSATSGSPDQYSIDYDATAQGQGFVDVINNALPASSITLTIPGAANPGTYNGILTVRNSGSGLSSINYDITVTINDPAPATPGTIAGDASVSPGATGLVYSISAVPTATSYTWSVPTGWTITAGSGTTSITVTAGGLGQDGDISVTADNSCGNSAASTLGVIVAANPPTITLSTTSVSVCQGETSANLSYSATTDSPDLYSIDYTGGAPGQGFVDVVDAALPASPIVLVIPGGANTGTYNGILTVTNSGTGLTSTDYAITITINAVPGIPTITPSGATTFCSPGSVTLTSSATTGTYLWSTAETSQSIIVSTSGSYTVTITENGCTSASSTPEVITVNTTPSTPGAIAGTTNATPNTAGYVYSISSVAGATSYNWTVPTGWSITAGTGTTSITVISGADGQNGNITVTAQNTCGISAASTLAVTSTTAASSPTITLGADPKGCPNTTADLTYSATTDSPDQYSINYSSVAETEGFTDVVNASLPVSPIPISIPTLTSGGVYTATLTVRNSSTGLVSSNYPITVTVYGESGSISGEITVGPALNGYIYSIDPVMDATGYTWSVPTNWTIDAGQNTESISVTTGGLTDDGNVQVTVDYSCGTSPPTFLVVSVEDPSVQKHSMITCASCHTFHNSTGSTLTNAAANADLCLSCHTTGKIGEGMPFLDTDKAIPGINGNSHSWGVFAANTGFETNIPSNSEMSVRLTTDDRIVCSTCHNQHNSAVNSPYLRIDNTGDAMCKDCHSARNLGRYADDNVNNIGSHPVGLTYPPADPTNFNDPPTGTVDVSNGTIECSSCHQVHYAASSDGYLLRQAANDGTLCTSCHANYGSHNGADCIDCHAMHNYPNRNSNIYLIKDSIFTNEAGGGVLREVIFTSRGTDAGGVAANSYADGDGTYNGVCEVCHTTNSNNFHYNSGTGDHTHNIGLNCVTCHPHDSDFAPSGGDCTTCHQDNTTYPYLTGTWNISDAHVAHITKYSFACSTCHSGNNHNDGTVNVAFNPNGLATRNGQDANTPNWDGTSCSNVYCHSNGKTAERGWDGVGTYTWGGNAPSYGVPFIGDPQFYATMNWSSGSITACTACHGGLSSLPPDPYDITDTGPYQATTAADFPNTGGHGPLTSQHLSGNEANWGGGTTQCFWCHDTDDRTAAGGVKKQGTYGTSFHVDGETHFTIGYTTEGGTGNVSVPRMSIGGHCSGRTCWGG